MNDQTTPTPIPETAYGMRKGRRSQVPPLRFQVSSATPSPIPTGTRRVPPTHSSVLSTDPRNRGSSNIST